ncbi:hypothetical protein DPMN_048110 [Dreissena polymorpha]|uniref:Uncharacterized protein n=1 Tax=Dreissena polymorpha TaxID=45954 RepID=A0A9D4HZT2_DREPO|nr:hypothetical protein DPMN_048110 [Dreissena polymorpha]
MKFAHLFELNQHIMQTNILTKLHEDWARNVTYSVYKVFLFLIYFQLDRDIIGTNILTKFHEDQTRNVASSVYKPNVNDGRTYDRQRPVTKAHLIAQEDFEVLLHL